ncbi:MAG: hypothetical protein WCY05_08040 [Candidatus Omnitrophota bacterium]
MNKKTGFILPLLLLFIFPSVFAETIVLKSGKTIEGKILEKTDKYIKVDTEGIAITYYLDDIASIDGNSAMFSSKQVAPIQNKVVTEKQNQDNDVTDHQDIFKKRLSDFLALSQKPDFTDKELDITGNKLLQFSKEYPNSKFAVDAEYLYRYLGFVGAVSIGDKDRASMHLGELEKIINLHPNDSLTEFTYKNFKTVSGGDESSGIPDIPYKFSYKDSLLFLRGVMGAKFNDYQTAIDNLSLLKDKMDINKDNTGKIAYEIYMPLFISYQATNRLDKCNEVAKEAIAKFPNTNLAQTMQEFLDENKGK